MTDENKTFSLRTDNVTTDNSAPGQLVRRKFFEFGVLTWHDADIDAQNGFMVNYNDDTGANLPHNDHGIHGVLAQLSREGWQVVAMDADEGVTNVWLQRESTPVVQS